jgi:hypothetical protein
MRHDHVCIHWQSHYGLSFNEIIESMGTWNEAGIAAVQNVRLFVCRHMTCFFSNLLNTNSFATFEVVETAQRSAN